MNKSLCIIRKYPPLMVIKKYPPLMVIKKYPQLIIIKKLKKYTSNLCPIWIRKNF